MVEYVFPYYYLVIPQIVIFILQLRMIESNNNKYATCAATWKFGEIAVDKIVPMLEQGISSIDAVEMGICAVELDNNDQYCVGFGGFPNAEGVMELDAAIMDHKCRYGAVMGLTDILNPISVARTVMDKCIHNILVGEGALKWALSQGFTKDPNRVLSSVALDDWIKWKKDNMASSAEKQDSHDTIGVICLDKNGHLCAGTSTSGWKYKHPGRVGDAPLVGSGLYCDGSVGAAVATGDGEEIMRTCLSFLAVEYMRAGKTPQDACKLSIERLLKLESNQFEKMHSKLTVGLIAMNSEGKVGAASTLTEENDHRGLPNFPVAVWRENVDNDNNVQFIHAGVTGVAF